MRFPRPVALGLAPVLAIAGLAGMGGSAAGPAISRADEQPVMHAVKYSVWTETPVYASIYYRDTDPPTFADYSHNPYQYSPNVKATVGPDKYWVLDVTLAYPDLWAMVVAQVPLSPSNPNFHCVLAVDGNVVVTSQGPKGALCSIRTW